MMLRYKRAEFYQVPGGKHIVYQSNRVEASRCVQGIQVAFYCQDKLIFQTNLWRAFKI